MSQRYFWQHFWREELERGKWVLMGFSGKFLLGERGKNEHDSAFPQLCSANIVVGARDWQGASGNGPQLCRKKKGVRSSPFVLSIVDFMASKVQTDLALPEGDEKKRDPSKDFQLIEKLGEGYVYF